VDEEKSIRIARRVVRIFKITIAGALLLFGIAWSTDYFLLQHRIAQDAGYGQIKVSRAYAITQRNKRVEENAARPELEECVRSLFPHEDESPCWYLARHTDQHDSINGSPWRFWAPD
jgi:hypothetical protein